MTPLCTPRPAFTLSPTPSNDFNVFIAQHAFPHTALALPSSILLHPAQDRLTDDPVPSRTPTTTPADNRIGSTPITSSHGEKSTSVRFDIPASTSTSEANQTAPRLRRRSIPASFQIDEMRFPSNTKPTLTPLGHRLLHLSELKLSNLEPGLGARDDASALWKGVVVREAVRSAWKSVDEPSSAPASPEFTDWRSETAMGLGVVDEADEENWFEEIYESLGEEDDFARQHEWAESKVYSAFEDEVAPFPAEEVEDGVTVSAAVAVDDFLGDNVEVDVVEVADEYDYESEEDDDDSLSAAASAFLSSIPDISTLATSPSPRTPSLFPSPSPSSTHFAMADSCEDVEDFALPPPLIRSMSASTSSSEDCSECVTPASSCEDLEDYTSSPELHAGEVDDCDAETDGLLDRVGAKLGRVSVGEQLFGLGLDIGF